MGSTFTTNNGIEKIGLGEQSGTWGNTTNNNFDIIDRLVNGVGNITLTGNAAQDHTLQTSDGSLSDGMFKVLVLGGTPNGPKTIKVNPLDQAKLYFVRNNCGRTVTFEQGGNGDKVDISTGKGAIIYCEGTGANTSSVVDLTALFVNRQAINNVVIGGTTPAAGTFTTLTANGGVTVDNINIDGTEIDLSSGDLTVDVAGNIDLDADGGTVKVSDGGTEILNITNSSSDVIIKPVVDGKDIIFQQRDGTEVARIKDDGTFNVVTDKFAINGTAVTSTATELNILDGVTATTAELNKLDGVTRTTSQINSARSGTVTSVSGGTGISVSSGTSTPTVSLNTGIGNVGTYAFLARQGYSKIEAGQTYTNSGSGANNNSANLVYAGFLSEGDNNFDDDTALDSTGGDVSTGLNGVWRAMGSADATNRVAATLFLRIS